MIICILAVSLFFLVCPTPLLIFRLNSIMQPGAFNTCVHWVYVIVWMRMCSAIHGLSRKLHCSTFDLLIRIDRQVPDRSPSTLQSHECENSWAILECTSPSTYSFLSSSKCCCASIPPHLLTHQSKDNECMA